MLTLHGIGGSALLQTYETERQPVGQQVVERAFQSLLQLGQLGECLGLQPGQTATQRAQALSLLHADAAGTQVRAKMEALRQLLDQNFNAHGVELGYRYRSGARVDDGSPEPSASGHPDVHYVPTTWPGARLPHAWLQQGRRLISTLDLCAHGKFVLLTGPSGQAWGPAAQAAGQQIGITVEVFCIDAAASELRDIYGSWRKLREVDEDGAVLVRPDQHVAWRCRHASGASALAQVLQQLLGLR